MKLPLFPDPDAKHVPTILRRFGVNDGIIAGECFAYAARLETSLEKHLNNQSALRKLPTLLDGISLSSLLVRSST